jgi:radical SAM superfamily enzyme YgiQ (UPF0313 family)
MKHDVPRILLINPWIHDFAAYDFWARPLGLLILGGILRTHGYKVSYLDCLDRFHPAVKNRSRRCDFGRGNYMKTPLPKPPGLRDVPRIYSRYGIPEFLFRKAVADAAPDVILVTSLMTYWYPGVLAVIRIVRQMMPQVPVLLGGIYATICHDHAVRHADADQVLPGEGEATALQAVDLLTGFSGSCSFLPDVLDTYPYPCLDLQSAIPYVPILTSRGCPYRCRYCASAFLTEKHERRSPEHVVEEIRYWHERYAVRDFAFYDDALLMDPERHILPMLEMVLQSALKVRFHTPNALHVRPLSQELATLLFRAGFKTVRLGLETAVFKDRGTLDSKLGPMEFERAVTHLKQAGFTKDQVGAYLLFGLPGQDSRDLEASVKIVKDCGVQPILAEYSPIPHTALWKDAVAASRYDLASDPIFHNNSIFPCQKEPFHWKTISDMKRLAQ